jgi:mitofusin 2
VRNPSFVISTSVSSYVSSLLDGLSAAKPLLSDIRIFNKDSWTLRYPKLRPKSDTVAASPMHHGLRCSLSFMDDPSSETDVILERSFASSLILTSIGDTPENDSEESPSSLGGGGCLIPESEVPDFHVFRLDLNLGAPGSLAAAGALVSQLEKVSIANLVDERMVVSSQHIDKLYVRVEDTSSKRLGRGQVDLRQCSPSTCSHAGRSAALCRRVLRGA